MAYPCNTPAGSGRYLVAFQRFDADGAHVFKVYCGTIAEARSALVANMRCWKTADEVHNALSNGFTASTLPAAMVEANTRRYGRCIVGSAVSQAAGGTLVREEAVVIRL